MVAPESVDKKPAETTDDGPTFDDVLRLAGGSGRWQLKHIVWLSKTCINLSFFLMGMIFLGAEPEHRCADGFAADVGFASLPADAPRCPSAGANCSRWVYDTSDVGNTVVAQWHLVCGRKPLLSLLQSVPMAGGLLGALTTGMFADRFGRRPVTLAGSTLYAVTALASCAVHHYQLLLAIRFVSGVGCAFSLSPLVVLILEIVTPEWRLLIGLLIQVPFALGVMALSAMAYLLPNWWHLQLAMAIPTLLYIIDFWVMPESPRWLVRTGRLPAATAVLRRIAATNGAVLPDDDALSQMLQRVYEAERSQKVAAEANGCLSFLGQLVQLLRTPQMRRYMLVTFFCWLAAGLSYFGIAFDLGQLSASRYVANCLSGLVEIPAYIVPWMTATRWGRRPTVCALFLLAAASILPVVAVRDWRLSLTLGLLGKFAVTGAFGLLYVYTPEYVPTLLRTIGLGAASVSARIGSIVAPFIIDLAREAHPSAPTVVFGVLALLAGLGALLLPETAGRHLPETVAELESGAWLRQPPDCRETIADLLPGARRDQRAAS
ncbi:organic cation transporter protein-like [Amphibalanus amphitrite]|uniref:organic cation transporter protein-like n=1 Tax=Amphibalanus amphitrite TaxID=1232801 RepID=UPI001C9041C9|nr:organic cation transporter protein-like [Amphibalanus amphitrite]